MKNQLIFDIIHWDTVNWSKALTYWEKHFNLQNKQLICCELGGVKGGLSLWLALKGHQVICSDLDNPKDRAFPIHQKYNLNNLISYKAIDASNIELPNTFDVITFKSILGGVARNNRNQLKTQVINEIYQSLKPNGALLFAENLKGSWFHQTFRKLFVKWGSDWNYLSLDEIESLFKNFKKVSFKTIGFFGAFGRTEAQRRILGKLDGILNPIIPHKMKYVVYGVAIK